MSPDPGMEARFTAPPCGGFGAAAAFLCRARPGLDLDQYGPRSYFDDSTLPTSRAVMSTIWIMRS